MIYSGAETAATLATPTAISALYRRDHLRALAQRVEVADDEVRIMGSKSELLRTLITASSVETSAFMVLY